MAACQAARRSGGGEVAVVRAESIGKRLRGRGGRSGGQNTHFKLTTDGIAGVVTKIARSG